IMEEFKSIWQTFAAIADMDTRLEALTVAIGKKSGVQGTRRTGVAEGKNRAQIVMIGSAAEIAGDLHSLAIKNKDDVLAAQVNIHETDLIALQDADVAPRCRTIYNLAVANAAALADYGVSAEDIAALDAAITAYEPKITAPRQAAAARKDVTGDSQQDENLADA